MKQKQPSQSRLIPDPKVWDRYGVTPMTGYRWDQDPDLNFPPPIVIRGRKYRDEDALAQWEAEQAEKGTKGRKPGRKLHNEESEAA